jgi:NADH-quinone oxidoreductase subunit M
MMELNSSHLLSLILFIPLLSGVLVLFLPADKLKAIRWTAFSASLVPFVLTIFLWTQFKSGQPGFQFQEQYVWYAALHSTFHIGVDGLSLTMVLLTTLLTPLALLASFNISDRIKP